MASDKQTQADVTLTRKETRSLLDAILDRDPLPDGLRKLADALDEAQGDAGDDGRETLTIEIIGGEI